MEKEQNNINERPDSLRRKHPQNVGLSAVIIIVAGIALLLSRIPQTANLFPGWLFDWPMILILIGFISGVRHGFRNTFFWLMLILFGVYFLLQNHNALGKNLNLYILPVFLIAAGFFLLFRRNHIHNRRAQFFHERIRRKQEFWERRGQRFNDKFGGNTQFTDNSDADFLSINSVFGNSEKSMFTKTFKGGNISASFGGAELDLSQSDMEDTAVLNVNATFGGVELRVPANWTVQNELSVIMGGIEDKRRISAPVVPPKILILRGSIFCGGVEIKN